MVTSGAITQRLDKLEERGLVKRTPSETENRLLAGLSAAERETLADTLRKLLESLGDTTD